MENDRILVWSLVFLHFFNILILKENLIVVKGLKDKIERELRDLFALGWILYLAIDCCHKFQFRKQYSFFAMEFPLDKK